MNNNNSDLLSNKTKCYCIRNLITNCFKKKIKKKVTDQNSELTYILTRKKDFLRLTTQNKDMNIESTIKNSTGLMKNSTTRINNTSNSRKNLTTNSKIINLTQKRNPPEEKKKFFHEFKDKLRCFFCGGRNCKHENYINNIKNNNAIEGLNSNFITENVIASQRPSEILIQKYKLIQKFKELNIGLIVNLQREGEHPYCGPNAYKLTSSGFSYNPSVFSSDDIKIKLSGWKDMSVPTSMNYMLDIVKEMSIVTIDKKNKVIVHCHAGYGRTGVVIVCYLLYNSLKDCDTVIKEVKSKRKKCVETKNQIKYCKKFEEFLNHSRILFGEKESIDVYLKRQEDLLFGDELNKYGFIPKIIVKVIEKICFLRKKYNLDNAMIYKFFQGVLIDWNDELENILCAMKKMINKNNWTLFEQTENIILIIELLFDWFEDCVEYIISPERTENIILSNIYNEYNKEIESFINGKNILENNKCKQFFDFIKKEYYCFEYEILFYFASFLIDFPPTGIEEENNFDKMIDRISLELLGFSFSEKNNNDEYNKITYPLIKGLSNIIKAIYFSLKVNVSLNINENDVLNNSFYYVCPQRKNVPIKVTYSNNDTLNTLNQVNLIPRKRKSMFLKSNLKFLRNSNVSESSGFSSPLKIKRQKTGTTGNFCFYKGINGINSKAELKKIYDILSLHFSNKKTISNDDSNVNLNNNRSYLNKSNEEISIDYCYSPDKNVSGKSQKLEEVIEEILKNNPSSCSSSCINVSMNSKNSKKSIKKCIFKSELSPITALNIPKKINNKKVIKNNYINEEKKKEIINNAINNIKPLNLYSKSKSIIDTETNEDEISIKKNKTHLRKTIVDELRIFNQKNSDVKAKTRRKGLDMSKCKNKSDRALIDLMKYMNTMEKIKILK